MSGKARRGHSAGPPDASAPAPAPAPAPPPDAPNPTSSTSTSSADDPGTSVSTDSDASSYALITADSPHSRRAYTHPTSIGRNNNNIPSARQAPSTRSGAIDFSTHPEFDLSDDGVIAPQDSGGTQDSGGADASNEDLASLIAHMELLRTQARNIQSQLDDQHTFNQRVDKSFTTVKSELQTLRDGFSTNHSILSRTQATADEAQVGMLQCTAAISVLTSKLDAVQSTVSDLISSKPKIIPPATSPPDSPPVGTEGIASAFAAADTAISNGITDMVNELGSDLDRTISARSPPHTADTSNVRFSGVTNKWNGLEPYDSEAAYAAAQARRNTAPHTPSSEATTDRDYSTRAQDLSSTSDHRRDVKPNSFGDALSPRYNGPSSPRYRSALTRGLPPDVLAWHAGKLTGGDNVSGLDFMEAEDVELLDIPPDMAIGVAENHFDIVTNWTNPRWMQRDVRDFSGTEDGYNAPSTGGPDITGILKQIANWDKLSDLSPTGWHAFYNKLRRFSFKWKIALMPFGAINLKYQCHGHGLCTCGLGLTRYKNMGDALFLILEYLLPTSNPIITSTLETLAVSSSTANGYTLLWTLLREFIPMLDSTTPTQLPTWPESDDIFQFARLIIMYCDLSQHRGPPYTEAMKSRLFLSTVRGRYISMATQFTAMVATYCPGRDGAVHCTDPLPRHLSVLELARTFYDEAARMDTTYPATFAPPVHAHQTVLQPSLLAPSNDLHGTSLRTSSSHSAPLNDLHGVSLRSPTSSVTQDTNYHAMSHPTHIQGFVANTTRTTSPRRRSAPNPTARNSRSLNAPRYQSACEACGKYGHPANRCDMLAMALFIQRYARDRSNAEVIKALEAQWVERNKPFLPRDDRTPRTILANYCAEFEFSEDMVDTEMDWEYLFDPTAVGHHTPMTAHQPHTSHHLTYTSLTTSSAYFLTIRKSTILAHTPHTPSQSSA